MNNQTDTFENIAKDAVDTLIVAVAGLKAIGTKEALALSLILSLEGASFCDRAIALGGR